MNFTEVQQLIGRWGGTLKYFPSDENARIGIAEELGEMAGDIEQIRWLVKRLPKLFTDWPGMLEVRAVLCSKFKPADGVEVYSKVYLEGVPSEKAELPALPAPPRLQLASGGPVTSAGSIQLAVAALAASKDMNRTGPAPRIPEIPVRQITAEERAKLMADILRLEREKKAAKKLEVLAS